MRKRWNAVLDRLPPGPVVGVELGVLIGLMSEQLLRRNKNLFLYLVDIVPRRLVTTEEFAARRKAIWKPSLEAVKDFEDKSLDFAFLDNDHTFNHVHDEIIAWLPKVKPGGWLCGHDYGSAKPGVKKAVDELSGVEFDDDYTWFLRVP